MRAHCDTLIQFPCFIRQTHPPSNAVACRRVKAEGRSQEKRTAVNIIKVIGITFSISPKLSPYPSVRLVFFYGSSSPPRRKDLECAIGVTLCAGMAWQSIRLTGNFFLSYEHLRITCGRRHIELIICFLERVLVAALRSTHSSK